MHDSAMMGTEGLKHARFSNDGVKTCMVRGGQRGKVQQTLNMQGLMSTSLYQLFWNLFPSKVAILSSSSTAQINKICLHDIEPASYCGVE